MSSTTIDFALLMNNDHLGTIIVNMLTDCMFNETNQNQKVLV